MIMKTQSMLEVPSRMSLLMSCRAMNFGGQRGTLQFFDNPDPQGARSVNSRLVIQIRDEPHLPEILRQINYR
jgi:hypothetical protein